MTLIIENLDAILYGLGLFTVLAIFMPYSPLMIDLLMLPRDFQVAIYRHRFKLWPIVWLCTLVVLARSINGVAEPAGWSAPIIGFIQSLTGAWSPGLVGTGDAAWLSVTVITFLVMAMMFWTGYVPYVMTPPKNPRLLDIADADKLINDEDMVLGVVNGGETHAYPRDFIARPHFFNDTVGGTPMTVSYCILCNSGMAFKSELKGKPMDLKCVTAFNNNIIYRDPATENYIQQLDGTIFHGPDKGTALDPHPVVQASWGDWKALHPETKLYYAPAATIRDKIVGLMLEMMIPIRKLSKRKKPWHRIRGKLDTRLPAMSYVYAVEQNGERTSYAEDDLKTSPVVNDTVGGADIVVLYDSEHDFGDVFSRDVAGRTLTFTAAPGPGGVVAKDNETGSTWSVTGKAIDGDLAGQSLTAVPHYNKLFWFSWPLFKPDTRLGAAG